MTVVERKLSVMMGKKKIETDDAMVWGFSLYDLCCPGMVGR